MTDDTAESIRDMINHMQSQIRSLQALGRSWENIANDLFSQHRHLKNESRDEARVGADAVRHDDAKNRRHFSAPS
ncbi:hypothetical protein WH47_05391 [Habropoda laboriosa]|uniref:Uncharacterized protein n=1 Tax=Habropoda laboriosa TaxID=597456 RepID=A0A0L7QJH2_9HYME|nr:hypothetical protein WH47_05391 [Habropoda laboriosa]